MYSFFSSMERDAVKITVIPFPEFDSSPAMNPDKMGIFKIKFAHFCTTNSPFTG